MASWLTLLELNGNSSEEPVQMLSMPLLIGVQLQQDVPDSSKCAPNQGNP